MSRRAPDPVRVLVPMKPLAQAKSRLWSGVPVIERQAAVLLMLDRVLRASGETLSPSACQVVGGSGPVRRVTELAGAEWRPERGADLNSTLWLAMREAYADGCAAALFLPGDLPCVRPADVRAVVAASGGLSRPAGVRAERDGGTNALLAPSACAFEPLLGQDSFARHREAAERQGTPLVEASAPGVAFDMDTYEDYVWTRDNLAGFAAQLDVWQAWLREENS